MKPLGPIPPGFAAKGGELVIAGQTASALVAQAGSTPLFVYALDRVQARIASLRAAMPPQLALALRGESQSLWPAADRDGGTDRWV